jgi:hypothetical protein
VACRSLVHRRVFSAPKFLDTKEPYDLGGLVTTLFFYGMQGGN